MEHLERLMSGTYYEFFAGGGMARAGLGTGWQCLFANDIDPDKAASYKLNWGSDDLHLGDIAELSTDQLPGHADLAWASFPCQDLSLAGAYKGLNGSRSGTFWYFLGLMEKLKVEGREPKLIVLENVLGALTSHAGQDFSQIAQALVRLGYHVGAIVVDAKLYLPQSRPRMFIIGSQVSPNGLGVPVATQPEMPWHTSAIVNAYDILPQNVKDCWVWWSPKTPPARKHDLADILERAPDGVEWHSEEETSYLLSLMSPLHRLKVEQAVTKSLQSKRPIVGGVYRRTREGQQRAEVRFDGLAGCLRTPGGGSSRQTLIIAQNGKVMTRLLSPREAARLMGLPDSYIMPKRYNQAYKLAGDGVVVAAVRHLANDILEPLALAEGFKIGIGVAAE